MFVKNKDQILRTLESFPEKIKELYGLATDYYSEGKFSEAADTVEEALKTLHTAEEKEKQSWGFAELQLLYGKALLETIKKSAATSDDIFGPQVPRVVPVGDTEENRSEEKQDDADETEDEKDLISEDENTKVSNAETTNTSVNPVENSEDGKIPGASVEQEYHIENSTNESDKTDTDNEKSESEEQDIRELIWEQFECARVIFTSFLPDSKERLAITYEGLGDFGMENDDYEQAAEDYRVAIKYYEEVNSDSSRLVSGLHHSIYLALRSINPTIALEHLRLAAQIFERRIAEQQKQGMSDKHSSTNENDSVQEEKGNWRFFLGNELTL
eukprot:jgi/Galph1/3445/GphlegSOOS_G2097.1